MWEWFNKRLDRIESRIALSLLFWGSGVISILTGWWARASAWVGSFGEFAWVLVGLLTLLVCLLILLCGIEVVYRARRVRAIQQWSEKADRINPLDDVFTRQRIKLSDLVDPLTGRIEKKTFRGCDLLGPCVLRLYGRGSMTNVGLINCDVIEIGKGPKQVNNVIVMEECDVVDGKIGNVTILAPEAQIQELRAIGAAPLTDDS